MYGDRRCGAVRGLQGRRAATGADVADIRELNDIGKRFPLDCVTGFFVWPAFLLQPCTLVLPYVVGDGFVACRPRSPARRRTRQDANLSHPFSVVKENGASYANLLAFAELFSSFFFCGRSQRILSMGGGCLRFMTARIALSSLPLEFAEKNEPTEKSISLERAEKNDDRGMPSCNRGNGPAAASRPSSSPLLSYGGTRRWAQVRPVSGRTGRASQQLRWHFGTASSCHWSRSR